MSTDELNELEAALRSLQPRVDIDQGAILYAAGRSSAPRGWFWPSLATASTLTAVVLGGLLLWQAPPQVVTQTIYVKVPVPAPSPPSSEPVVSSAPEPYLAPTLPQQPLVQLEEQVARWGLEALPNLPPSTPSGLPMDLPELRRPYSSPIESWFPLR